MKTISFTSRFLTGTALSTPQALARNTKGTNVSEYGLVTGLVGLLAIALITGTGGNVRNVFTAAGTEMTTPGNSGFGQNQGNGQGNNGNGNNDNGNGNNGGGSTPDPDPEPVGLDPNCLSAAPGTIGEASWNGCAGMLIVSEAMLRAASSSNTGGDNSFNIAPGNPYAPAGLENTYTFANGPFTIFTGQVGNFADVFANSGFTGDISHWNTVGATNMSQMFANTAFNPNIGGWDVSNVTNMNAMFQGNNAFSGDLSGWCVTNINQRPNQFTPDNVFTAQEPFWGYCGQDALPSDPMILRIAHGASAQYGFHLNNADALVDWGNGKRIRMTTSGTGAPVTSNNMGPAETRFVRIYGSATGFRSTGNSTATNAIISFGNLGLVDLQAGFEHMPNLTAVDTTLPSTVRNLRQLMDNNATANPSGIGNWDVSLVTDMNATFRRARAFNQNLSNWNTGSVTDMRSLFEDADRFNQPIGSWNVTGVSRTNMANIFSRAVDFNQNISTWCVSHISSAPNEFNTNGNLALENRPNWGAACN